MSRFARERRVLFFEEPVFEEGPDRLRVETTPEGVLRVVPRLGPEDGEVDERLARLLDELLREQGVDAPVLWYYTPMALGFTAHLRARAIVYDAMDELSLFAFAPPGLVERERELLARADLVFTGGPGLYQAKRDRHPDVHCFPSSIDAAHFRRARLTLEDPPDQVDLPRPRLGFFGVLDERLDRELLATVAERRPDWHFVLVGPVVKIDPGELPRGANLHYPGLKPYGELPRYIAGWDVALMPWARNDATRFISPTKTPEYLAAGKPVVSTSIQDVVRLYGARGLVDIADSPDAWVEAVERLLARTPGEREAWLDRVDRFLAGMSWDRTWEAMSALLDRVGRSGAGGEPRNEAGTRPDHGSSATERAVAGAD